MSTGKGGSFGKGQLRRQVQITLSSLVHNINNNLIKARTNNISFLVHNINIQAIGHIFSHIFKFNIEGMHPLCGALVLKYFDIYVLF